MKSANNKPTKAPPPYVGFATFRNLLDRLHEYGVPNQIDRKVMGSEMSGSIFSYLISALKFLGLVDANGVSQPSLEKLADAVGDERKKLMRDLLRSSYSFIFAPDAKVDLTKETDTTLRKKFIEYGVTDELAKKCMAFFINAVHYAEIPISSYIHKPQQRSSRARGARPGGKQKEKPPKETLDEEELEDEVSSPKLTGEQILMRDLISQLDKIPPDWTPEQRERWMNNIKEMMMIVRGDKLNTESK